MSASIASSTPTGPLTRRTLRRLAFSAAVIPLALAAVAVESAALASSPAFLGNWARGDGKTHIRVERCGSEFCGVNTWVKGSHSGENVGDKLIADLKSAGTGRWSGSAFDPKRNRRYTMNIHVADRRMTTQGCIWGGMMCQSMTWTRLGSKS